jgi:hypothetical protein
VDYQSRLVFLHFSRRDYTIFLLVAFRFAIHPEQAWELAKIPTTKQRENLRQNVHLRRMVHGGGIGRH